MAETSRAVPTGGRERVLHEAFRKFAESGFASVSMQQIADSAGVTKATLYHHFRDKEDLFFEVMQVELRRSQANMARTIATGTSLHDKLLSFATHLFGSERTDLNRLFGDFHQHVSHERQVAFWETFQRPWSFLEEPIAEGIASGEILPGDPATIARVCFSAFIGQLQVARYRANVPAPDADLAEQIVDMLLNGLRPR